MEEENAVEVLQRYRRDRRVLLNFILSGSLIKKVVMPRGAVSLDDVDLDQVSVDFVLNCAKKGGMLELSEAIRDFHDATLFPNMNNAGPTDEFFLVTDSKSSGSPPLRAPPAVPNIAPSPILPHLAHVDTADSVEAEELLSLSKSQSLNSTQVQDLTVDDIDDLDDDDDFDEVDSRRYSRRVLNDAADLVLVLPSFATGLADDDLRETAYEILLAAAGASGGLIVPSKEKKKDKRSRLMRKLGRSKSEQVVSQSQYTSGLVGLLETMRVQMEISEGMDIRTRRGLLNAMVGKVGKRMDTLLIPLELLCCISRSEFPDKKSYIKWQKRQLNMLEEGLVNHPAVGFGESGRKANELRALLAKIEESELLPPSTGELQRTECLRSLREIAIPLAERPARGDLTGEVCHWADGYHLNVRLYEKLLLSVFDVLDEGKLTEEVEEILELLKSTWRILGITETIHHACFAWVLFRQFVLTSERGILQNAIEQLKKVPLKEQRGPQERLHLKSLLSRIESDNNVLEMTFLQSFLLPLQKWANKQLGDYHLHYPETVDQFFALKVPMRSSELNSLCRGIDNAFQMYAKHVVNQLANKDDIIPPVPILTRYSREGGIKALVKKEQKDPRLPDVKRSTEINVLTTPKLCVQLNTLHYAISQLNKLEDSIWGRWATIKHDNRLRRPTEENLRNLTKKETFDGSRRDVNVAIDRICEFTGTKVIFWDLREPFIDNLYKSNVSESRLERLIEQLDLVLNQLCDIIVEPLRDRVVTGLLQASLDGFLRVLLDGGSSRAFSPADAKLLEDDLEVLKEFFISGGDGLPRGVVENQVAHVRQVIKLHGHETRELIEELKSVGELEMQGGRSKLGVDSKTLLRILCHRSDSESSQFLKKHYKIPKSVS